MRETVKRAAAGKASRKSSTKIAPGKKSAPSEVHVVAPAQEEIAKLAHRFWSERGHQHGHHEDDWLRAEREILGKAS